MTEAQKNTIEAIRKAFTHERVNVEAYEWKKWVVNELGNGSVSLVLEFGRKNDEGTYAALFSRKYAHVFIGKRGGITTYIVGGASTTKRSLRPWQVRFIDVYEREARERRERRAKKTATKG